MNSNRYNRYYNTDDDDDDEEEKNSRDEENKNWDEEDIRVSIASRAMAFSFFWTGMSSIGLAVAGSMVIGVISPSGTYLTCCTSKISSTTPLSIGIFIGSLVMYANMAFICAILFGQFNVSNSCVRSLLNFYLLLFWQLIRLFIILFIFSLLSRVCFTYKRYVITCTVKMIEMVKKEWILIYNG